MRATPYNIAGVICPHDIKVRELGTGKTRLQRLRELGVTNIQVLPKRPILDGIERVRAEMDHIYIDVKCTYIQDCFKNYSKEFDEIHQVFKKKPVHNKWSHGADVIRGMVMSKARHIPKDKQQRKSRDVVDGMAM